MASRSCGRLAASSAISAQAVCEAVAAPRPADFDVHVGGAAFAPAAVGLLARDQPVAGAADIGRAHVLADGGERRQRRGRAVDDS